MNTAAPDAEATRRAGTERRSTWRAIVDGNVGQLGAQALSILRILLLARMLAPDVLGAYAALVLVFTYGANIHLGLFDGALRHVPRLRGEGRHDEARALQDTAFTGTLALSGLVVVGAAAFALLAPGLTPAWRGGLVLVAIAVLLHQVFNFVNLQDRVRMRFDRVRTATVVRAVVEFVVAVVLAERLQLLALPLALAAGILAALAWLLRGLPERFRLSFSAATARRTLAFGTPVLVVGLGLTVLMSLDRILILHYLDVRRMGYYVLGAQLGGVVYLVPTVVASVLYIRFLEQYGRSGSDPTALRDRADVSLRGTGLLAAFLAGGGLALTTPLAVLLPAYAPGMDAVRVALVGFSFLGVSSLANNILVAVDRTRWLLAAQVTALLAVVGLGVAAGTVRGSLVAVAAAVAAGFALYATLLLAGVDLRVAGRLRPGAWLRTYLPIIAVAAVSLAAFRLAPADPTLAAATVVFVLHGLAVVVVTGVLALPLARAERRRHGSPKQRPDNPNQEP